MVDIKKFLPKKGEDNPEHYWSLVLESGWVQAGIWKIDNDKAHLIASSPSYSWGTDEELMTSADEALSTAISDFPDELDEPNKTVFGVSASWVSDKEIDEEYLNKIKRLCSELSLKPIGFVVLPEAIAHFVKANEGTPLNALVVGMGKEELEISLFENGNLKNSTTVARSVSVNDDLEEGLVRFSQKDNLPPRILVYNGREGELEEARQDFLNVSWDKIKGVNFLHTPKIETVKIQDKIVAVSLAGASELAGIKEVETNKKENESSEVKERETIKDDFEDTSSEDEKSTPEALGFVLNEDIAGKGQPPVDEDEAEMTDERNIDDIHRNVEEVPEDEKVPKSGGTYRPDFAEFMQKVGSLFAPISSIKKRIPLAGTRAFATGLIFFVLLIVGGFLFWWFYPKATLTIYVSPKQLQERFETTVIVDGGDLNVEERTLPGRSVEVDVSGERTKDATGTKTVGERAKGEVTLYRVGTQLQLPSGTVLYGPDDLNYTLDEEVNLASGSAGSPGTVKASATAEDIGAQYNLASGVTFSVGDYSTSDVEAKNEGSFSGGTSREISAVSQDDLEVLEEDLKNELLEKAKADLEGKMTAEDFLIENALTTKVVSRDYSAKAGDESATVGIELSLNASALVVKREDLARLAKEVLNGKVPEGFVLRSEQIDFDLDLNESDDGRYELEVRASANLLPEVKTEEIAQKVKGKYPPLAEEYLKREVPGFVRAEVKIKPSLPGRLKTLPQVADNIEVEVGAAR